MSEIIVDRSIERVAVVTINRPHHRNACDLAAWTDLRDGFLRLASERDVRVAVLTGAGGHFCAGDDLFAFNAVRNDLHASAEYRARIQECYAAIEATPFPVIAAISGVCVGGGCSLAMCCDFRIGDSTARVGVPVARLGLVYPTIQLQRLVSLVGTQVARHWLYTGAMVAAETAEHTGFLDQLTGDPVVDAALRFAGPMLDGAPLSIAGSKRQLQAITSGQVATRGVELDSMVNAADGSDDFREASTAFAEKRKPRFHGR